jgi:hypothetical protein
MTDKYVDYLLLKSFQIDLLIDFYQFDNESIAMAASYKIKWTTTPSEILLHYKQELLPSLAVELITKPANPYFRLFFEKDFERHFGVDLTFFQLENCLRGFSCSSLDIPHPGATFCGWRSLTGLNDFFPPQSF